MRIHSAKDGLQGRAGRRLRLILIGAGCAALLFAAGWGVRALLSKAVSGPVSLSGHIGPSDADENKGPDAALSGVRQTAFLDGRLTWKLDADNVQYRDDAKTADLTGIRLTLHPEEGDPILLTADKGELDVSTNDLDVSGNVEVASGPHHLFTDELHYRHGGRIIFTRTPVRFISEAFSVSGDAFSLNIDNRRVLLTGNVEGTLH